MGEYDKKRGAAKAAHGGAVAVLSAVLAEVAVQAARAHGIEIPGGSATAAGLIGSALGWAVNLVKFKWGGR